MNKKEYPLIVIRAIKSTKDSLKTLTENLDFIGLENETETTILFVDSDNESSFSFEMFNPKLVNREPMFTIKYAPTSAIDNKARTAQYNSTNLLNIFKQWYTNIEDYNTTDLSPNDKILKTYEDEIYDDFELIDDGSLNTPFTYEQQMHLDNYLTWLVSKLEEHSDEEGIEEIVNDAKSLQSGLTNETKKTTVKKLSKLLSKIRKHGLKLIKEVFDTAKKEIIKSLLKGGFDQFGNWLN